MVKYIANAITSLRIIGSVVLLFFDVSSLPFYITYKDFTRRIIGKKLSEMRLEGLDEHSLDLTRI